MIDLEMLKRSGTAREKKYAERITPVCLAGFAHQSCLQHPLDIDRAEVACRIIGTQGSCLKACSKPKGDIKRFPLVQVLKRPHMLLVTLLLTNAAAMEVSSSNAAEPELFLFELGFNTSAAA